MAGMTKPTTSQTVAAMPALFTSQTATAAAVRVKAAAQTVVMTTLIRMNWGVSQYSRGALRRAMPRVNGRRMAMLPQAVSASQPNDSVSV